MRYTQIRVKIADKPPYFLGSQIRGALGYALKRVVCININHKCEGCFSADNCLYYDFYEKKNVFHKYRLDYRLGQKKYDFSIFLFNEVAKKTPYLISALYRMITQIGFGVSRKKFENFQMFLNEVSIYKRGQFEMPQNYIKEFQVNEFKKDVVLEFVTPLRIKKGGKFLESGENLELFDIVNSIYQRNLRLNNLDFKKIDFQVEGEITKRELRYKKLTRLSNRQKMKMQMDGWIGKIEIKNLNKKCYELLKLGEIIGVGKSTTFGLGKVEVK